jgi:chloride channel 7
MEHAVPLLRGSDETVAVAESPPLHKPLPPPPPSLDSLDFSLLDSAVRESAELSRTPWEKRSKRVGRWLLLAAIGVAVGALGFIITWTSQYLQRSKLDVMHGIITAGSDNVAGAFIVFLAISLAYGLLAAIPTAMIAPSAASGGISEVVAILNGVSLPSAMKLETLAVKIFGNVFGLSSGAPIGAEGPMVHVGAIVSSLLSQGQAVLGLPIRRVFGSDVERRDFIVAGASAGLAAAFGAPVGSVLFAVEECTSHWHRSLVWRIFFCSVVAAYTVDFLFTGIGTPVDPTTSAGWGTLTHPGMFSFGSFTGKAGLWSLWELPVFASMGIAGGLLGAGFVALSRRLMRLRAVHCPPSAPMLRVSEVAAIVILNSVCKFFSPYVIGTCKVLPSTITGDSFQPTLVQFYCPAGQYNDLASLFMGPSEDVIRSLFHFTHADGSNTGPPPFTFASIAVFVVMYSGLAVLSNGVAWPSGLFIPALLAGSAFGRLVGEGLNLLPSVLPASAPASGQLVDPGSYALIGAAALLGGSSRLTITISALLLESTGNYVFSLPIMVTVLSARIIGSIFNRSIYEVVIEEKGYPVLPPRPPSKFKHLLRAQDVMTRQVMVLPTLITAGALLDALKSCGHSGFPVVHSESLLQSHPRLGNLAGYIQRRHLSVLLSRRTFHAALPSIPFLPGNDAAADIRLGRQAAAYSVQIADGAGSGLDSSGGYRNHGKRRLGRPPAASSSGRPELPRTGSGVRLRMPSVPSLSVDAILEAVGGGEGGRLSIDSKPNVAGGGMRYSKSGTKLWMLQEEGMGPGKSADGSIGSEGRRRARTGSPHGTGWDSGGRPGEEDNAVELLYMDEPMLSWKDLEADYPRYPSVDGLELSAAERAMYVDLRPYMDPCPVTVSAQAPLERAYQLFNACGLRHLLVTNDAHDVTGIITRRELQVGTLGAHADAKRTRQAAQASMWDEAHTALGDS